MFRISNFEFSIPTPAPDWDLKHCNLEFVWNLRIVICDLFGIQ
jgi:hypothetical protein